MSEKPLSAVAVLALSSLADGPRHGYAVKQDVAARSGGDVRPGATSLYRTLWQLLDDGLIAESAAAAHGSDERRRYFRITPAGRRTLDAELARLRRLIDAAQGRSAARGSRA